MLASHRTRYTRAEYISLERMAGVKHEFLDGVIYAMAGGSREHARYAANVIRLLGNALRGRPSAEHTSDLRVRIAETGLDTYPDASVICGRAEMDPEDAHCALNPTVLVEVTSPSTEAYDRGEKLAHYKHIPSLREVVFVSHMEKLVDVIRREADGTWSRYEARSGGAVTLLSLECELPVDEVSRDPIDGGP